nr:MAG TPA: hypothetical protein [Caudoviricetes sp.]
MAEFKGYEERLINSAYEVFKEAMTMLSKWGLIGCRKCRS